MNSLEGLQHVRTLLKMRDILRIPMKFNEHEQLYDAPAGNMQTCISNERGTYK